MTEDAFASRSLEVGGEFSVPLTGFGSPLVGLDVDPVEHSPEFAVFQAPVDDAFRDTVAEQRSSGNHGNWESWIVVRRG